MKIITHLFHAPSAWASYLVNGDKTGIDTRDRHAADTWIARLGLGSPVDAFDAGYCARHNAMAEAPYGADCQTYVFHENVT